MMVQKKYLNANRTVRHFQNSKKSYDGTATTTIPDIKTVFSGESSNANVRGKLKQLESEILEVNQVLNFHKKEIEILKLEKETLQQVLNK
jgi:hypothetical protein